jgi:hypothetical protein
MMQYQRKIGDKVRVRVDEDLLGDALDRSEIYEVTDIDENDGTIWLGSYNVHPYQVELIHTAENPAQAIVSLWRRGSNLVTADRSQHWAQIIDWMQQMNTLVEQLEREVNNG